MLQVSFSPSEVTPVFHNSAFANVEKEIVAGIVITYLTQENLEWDGDINAEQWFEHAKEDRKNIPSVFQSPFQNPLLGSKCVDAVKYLLSGGYLEWIEQGVTFRVTDKFVEFFSEYVR